MLKNKKVIIALIVVYCIIIFVYIFLGSFIMRAPVSPRYDLSYIEILKSRTNIIPFSTIQDYYIRLTNDRINIESFVMVMIGNLLILAPCGGILRFYHSSNTVRSIAIVCIVAFLIDFIQLISRIGFFDIDIIFIRILGGCIGYFIAWIIQSIIKKLQGGELIW